MNKPMKTIIISGVELIELSEGDGIELYCEVCKSNTIHKPIVQMGRGRMIDMGYTEEGDKIEVEDVEDAYVVQCDNCGNTVIAKRGRTLIPPP